MKKPSSKAKDIYFRVSKLSITKNSNIASLTNQSQELHKKYSNVLAHGLQRTASLLKLCTDSYFLTAKNIMSFKCKSQWFKQAV